MIRSEMPGTEYDASKEKWKTVRGSDKFSKEWFGEKNKGSWPKIKDLK